MVMPNLTPAPQRTKYALYRDKACMGAEAAEGVKLLEDELHSIGYRIDWGRGDHWGEAELVNE